MTSFEPSEILQFAVAIERNGEQFYRHAIDISKDEETRKIFHFLATEEVVHERTFQKMLDKIQTFQSIDTFPEEYFAYLRAFVDNVIFDDQRLQEIKKKVSTPLEAVHFAKRRELDTVLYYLELRNLVPIEERDVVDRVIQEERSHYLKLVNLEKTLTE